MRALDAVVNIKTFCNPTGVLERSYDMMARSVMAETLTRRQGIIACPVCRIYHIHFPMMLFPIREHLKAMEQAATVRLTTAGDESSSSWRSVLSTALRAVKLGCARTAASSSSTSCFRTGTAGSVCSSTTSGTNSCTHCRFSCSDMQRYTACASTVQ